ncbi:BTAD domain-containing putative transcriptional regulator [Nonomuraea longicatena]|uniref:BTAD domain-containing putative transcriptional regulator n=1 Tax=Nonomuraea longicatena TaxID=83682 RepID=A0ABN1QJM6_9ACTN
MRFGILGPLTVWTDSGEVVAVPGLKVRALLADLLAHEGRVVSVDRLVDDLWGDDAPANPAAALQVRVSQLRKALEDAEPGGRDLIVSRAPGYQLRVSSDQVDGLRFARLAAEGRLAEALELWRGAPYADFADAEFTRAAGARLEEQRLAALEEHAEARLAAGESVDVGDLVAAHPLRERLRAVQMKALYRSGRQGEALAAYAELRERLSDELGLDPSPELAELQERILRQDPELNGPVRRSLSNLPAAVTELIGREEAETGVVDLLGRSRLVTLTGSGGVGKTSLALSVATGLSAASDARFADGAWLVELAAYDKDTDSLADAVLSALDIRDGGGAGDALDRLVDALRSRRLLLVLDNCEHVVDQAATLADLLLRAAPGLRILATSREPLSVAGEALWSVPPLDLPEGEDIAQVEKSDAVRLFMARATASARGFALDEGNAAAVAQLCRRLDGLPLALELAATRVRSLGVHELVARLDDRFKVLAGWQRGVSDRQQTLVGMIDWSWSLLSEEERVVLRRLSVHADGCTLEAAEAVCGGDGLDVLDLLVRLVDRSLVGVVEGAAGVRYRLLESVAAYCRRRLEDSGEEASVRAVFVEHHTRLAAQAEGMLRGPEQAEWLRRLDAEAANLRAALDAAPGPVGLRLVNDLAWYWFLRGRLREARRAFDTALAVPAEDGADPADREQAAAWRAGFALLLGEDVDWRATLKITDPGVRARAEFFFSLGQAALPASRELTEDALVTFRELGDKWGEAAVLSRHARDAFAVREMDLLEQVGGESARLFRELGDGWGLLQATEWLGGLAEMRGRYDEAVRTFGEALSVAQDLGLWSDVARRLAWLGWLTMHHGEYARAMDVCEQALALAVGQGYLDGQYFSRMGLAFAARRAGRLELAEEHLNRMLHKVSRDPAAEPPLFMPSVLAELGYVQERRGDADGARALFLEALAAGRKIGDPRSLTSVTEALAVVSPPAEAARLLGLAAAARSAGRNPASVSEQAELTRTAERAIAALGEAEFEAARAGGAAQTFDDVP